MNSLLAPAVSLVLAAYVLGQVRKPTGPLGRLAVMGMNRSHAAMTDWGLRHVPIRVGDTILDIGCGGGRTVQRLAASAPEGRVHGIDFSPASVATASRTNAREIAAGRVQIQLGTVSALPFPERHFDVVTAVETHYYWPDLPADLSEVLRVVKPGGTFALIAETHRDGLAGVLYALPMLLIRAAFLSEAEHRTLLVNAGFTEVTVYRPPGQSWICAVGRRQAP